jgi:hypothetical protein
MRFPQRRNSSQLYRDADMARTLRTKAPDPIEHIFPPMARVRFDFQAIEAIRVPVYSGSAWRGLLGHSLRQTVCVTRQLTCERCLLKGTCAYSVFFESPPASAESASRYTALPHPFVLDVEPLPERDVTAGDGLRLGMTLIGPAIDLLPYLIQSMRRAGERGIGHGGGRFALRTVALEQGLGNDTWRCTYDAASGEYRRAAGERGAPGPAPGGALRLDLLTPLRIKRHGRFLGPAELAAADLLRNLTTRLSSVAAWYGDSPDPFDWRLLAAAAREVSMTASELRWLDWTRFSSRQQTTMQMGGLVGVLILDGPGLAALWPALWLGQWTHVGKGTSFGLGKYRLSLAGDGDPRP